MARFVRRRWLTGAKATVLAAVVACWFVACGGGGGGAGPTPPAPAGWVRDPANPLAFPGLAPSPATTYETAIADPSVDHDPATGTFRAWFSTTVLDRAQPGAPGRIVIKHATSSDGRVWNVQATPVLESRQSPGDWDYTHTETPSVVRNPDPAAPSSQRFLMFYAGANRDADVLAGRPADAAFPYYGIGLAYSADGTLFTRAPGLGGQAGLVLTAAMLLAGSVAGYGDGLCADPEVVVRDGALELWCSSYAERIDAGQRSPIAFGISHARSSDGLQWTLPTANPLASLFRPGDVAGGQQPAVVHDAVRGRYEMWFKNDTPAESASIPTAFFTALGFWRAVSADGITWTPDYSARDFVWRGELDYERYGLLTGAAVVRRGDVDLFYYCAWGDRSVPDPLLYTVPLQSGGSVPAVTSWSLAARAVR